MKKKITDFAEEWSFHLMVSQFWAAPKLVLLNFGAALKELQKLQKLQKKLQLKNIVVFQCFFWETLF